jgi:hypothetical protein
MLHLAVKGEKSIMAKKEESSREAPILVSILVARTMLGGISERAVWYLLKSGQLQGRRIGRRRLVLRSSIVRFCNSDHSAVRGESPADAVTG